jgi:hypothetical protein
MFAEALQTQMLRRICHEDSVLFSFPHKIESNYMFRKEYQERNNVDLRRKEDLTHGKRDFYGMRQTFKISRILCQDQNTPRTQRMKRPEDIRTFKMRFQTDKNLRGIFVDERARPYRGNEYINPSFVCST